MHKPESVLENETHNILRGFEIQTDHVNLAKTRDLELIDKKKSKRKENWPSCWFYRSSGPQSENKRKIKYRKILWPKNKKNCRSWGWQWYWLLLVCLERSQRLRKETERIGNQRNNRNHAEYWEEAWKPKEGCCYLDSCGRPSANEKLARSKIIIITCLDKIIWYSN